MTIEAQVAAEQAIAFAAFFRYNSRPVGHPFATFGQLTENCYAKPERREVAFQRPERSERHQLDAVIELLDSVSLGVR